MQCLQNGLKLFVLIACALINGATSAGKALLMKCQGFLLIISYVTGIIHTSFEQRNVNIVSMKCQHCHYDRAHQLNED